MIKNNFLRDYQANDCFICGHQGARTTIRIKFTISSGETDPNTEILFFNIRLEEGSSKYKKIKWIMIFLVEMRFGFDWRTSKEW